MCRFGMTQHDDQGEAPILKPTGFMTNSWEIAKQLSKRCLGNHRHITLQGNRTQRAQVYPEKLCRHIIIGLVRQMQEDGRLGTGEIGYCCAIDDDVSEWVDDDIWDDEYWDDISGASLHPGMVRSARQAEMVEVYKHNLYTKVPVSMCIE